MIYAAFKFLFRAGLALALLFLFIVLASAIWFGRIAGAIDEADVIVVLGAGITAEGALNEASKRRVAAGVRLYKAGIAPKILFTGGSAEEGSPTAADEMAALAAAEGVPESAMLREGRAQSTLQNAYFSTPMLRAEGAERVILVTEGYHMARALWSFRWAGLKASGAHVSTLFRKGSYGRMILREAMAWPYNVSRMIVWQMGGWRGIPEETRIHWLR